MGGGESARDRLPRPRVGRARSRRPRPLRVPDAGRCQAGLSWMTILGKRDRYRAAFAGFDPAKVARFDGRKVQSLLRDPGLVRNRLKIASAVVNARAIVKIQEETGSLSEYLWGFVGGRPITNAWRTPRQVPDRTPRSVEMSKDLKR